jgi:hypothetical protein
MWAVLIRERPLFVQETEASPIGFELADITETNKAGPFAGSGLVLRCGLDSKPALGLQQ